MSHTISRLFLSELFHRNKTKFLCGFEKRLLELMELILIISILISLSIPLMNDRIDKVKWSEACATASAIRRAVRLYACESNIAMAQKIAGTNLGNAETQATLGFKPPECEGTYFKSSDYYIASVDANGIAVIIVNGGGKANSPTGTYIMQQDSKWIRK